MKATESGLDGLAKSRAYFCGEIKLFVDMVKSRPLGFKIGNSYKRLVSPRRKH